MRLVVRLAEVARAPRLRDVTGAHIDSCLDHGRAGLDFAERLLAGGAEVSVPTTLNVSSLDLLHPELVRLDPETSERSRRLMDAYAAMGCRQTWTCAPYQLPDRPALGQHGVGRVERDRVRELRPRREDEPLRRLHRHLRRRSSGGCPTTGCTRTPDVAPRSCCVWTSARELLEDDLGAPLLGHVLRSRGQPRGRRRGLPRARRRTG